MFDLDPRDQESRERDDGVRDREEDWLVLVGLVTVRRRSAMMNRTVRPGTAMTTGETNATAMCTTATTGGAVSIRATCSAGISISRGTAIEC